MTVYVEGEKAARELGVRQRGGFFDDNRCRPAPLNTCTTSTRNKQIFMHYSHLVEAVHA